MAESNESPRSMEVEEESVERPLETPVANENDSQENPAESNDDVEDAQGDDDTSDLDDIYSDGNDSDVDFSPTQDPDDLLVQASTLKEEGNTHFKSGDLNKASRSYRKGTSMLKPLNKNNSGDEQVKALLLSLQTNLSMVCFKQNKPKLSLDVASKALSVDATNVKALYRRAAAHRKLGNFKEAREDLRDALKHDPNNTAVKRELVSLKKEMESTTEREKRQLQKAFSQKSGSSFLYEDKEEEQKKKEEEAKKKKELEKEALKKRKMEWEDDCVKRMVADQPAISFEEWEKQRKEKEEAERKRKKDEEKRKKKARAQAKKEIDSFHHFEDSEEELTEKELSMLRGYKKTADGRTTSYFTRELSEQEKKIIGDIAPQRLDESGAPLATPVPEKPVLDEPPQSSVKGAVSAWNQAGTWEERDTTDWCTSTLKARLLSTTSRDGTWETVITSIKDLTGDASVAITGGKKRYIFDFHTTLLFDVRDADDESVLASGSLKLPDICSTSLDELDIEILAWTKVPKTEHEANASKCRAILIEEVRSSVHQFVKDFNANY